MKGDILSHIDNEALHKNSKIGTISYFSMSCGDVSVRHAQNGLFSCRMMPTPGPIRPCARTLTPLPALSFLAFLAREPFS